MDWIEITLRLSAATLIGGVLGLNRDLHGKPTGVRTLGLVGLGSAMVVVFFVLILLISLVLLHVRQREAWR